MIAEPTEKAVAPEALPAVQEKSEVARLGKEIYQQVRAQYDTPQNQGKCLIIEVDTGDCEMIEEAQLGRRLYERGPSTRRFVLRIGQPSFYHYRSRGQVVAKP